MSTAIDMRARPYNPHKEENGSKRSTTIILAVLGAVVVGLLFVVPSLSHASSSVDGVTTELMEENAWRIAVIADLDKQSKADDKGKKFYSIFSEGRLTRDAGTGAFSAVWTGEKNLYSGHNEAGRGMELSELINWNGRLMTVDDRTGIVFEIRSEPELHVSPEYIITEGDGTLDKGMKLEWATVKDGKLVLGSFGKEYTADDGSIISTNNNWVSTIDTQGRLVREDWTERYNKMRTAVGAVFPGYVIHEAGAWSQILKKWVFTPRRISSEPYNDMLDEKMGSDTVLIMDEGFTSVDVRHVGEIIPTHGFSSFKFVPGTGDQVVVALKSEESEEADTQNTFLMVFTLDGEVLLPETAIPGGHKFEGIEVFPIAAATQTQYSV